MPKYENEKRHILDAIDNDECTLVTDKEKAFYSFNRFQSEMGWNIERKGRFGALKDWLSGLAIGIDYTNHKILENYKVWNGVETLTEKQEDKILDGYFGFMAMRLLDIWKEHKADAQHGRGRDPATKGEKTTLSAQPPRKPSGGGMKM